MPRYKLTIEYDGTNYAGWQKQDDQPSVQTSLENAAAKFCGTPTGIVGAGRTDSGVHAVAQIAHVDFERDHDPFRVMQGINYHLFDADHANRISVTRSERAADDFHARFSATKRRYVYRILNRRARLGLEAGRAWHVVEELDIPAMQQAAALLVGHHDFTSFRDTACQSKSPVKTLEQFEITRLGDEIRVTAAARSFLHHQVRILVGTLSLVGKGKWTPRDVSAALAARDRTKGGPTAPPEGLYLVGVDY